MMYVCGCVHAMICIYYIYMWVCACRGSCVYVMYCGVCMLQHVCVYCMCGGCAFYGTCVSMMYVCVCRSTYVYYVYMMYVGGCACSSMYVYDVCVWVCACHDAPEVRGQCCGVGCHPIPLCGCWGLNSDHQGWVASTLPIEPYHWPTFLQFMRAHTFSSTGTY